MKYKNFDYINSTKKQSLHLRCILMTQDDEIIRNL